MTTPNDTPETITIQLTRGYSTIIDAIDSDLAEYAWIVCASSLTNIPYALRRHKQNEKRINIHMHRVILSRILGRDMLPNEFVDHKNRNSLDNRRCNLRLATRNENNRNVERPKSKSGFRGVHSNYGQPERWKALIMVNGKQIYLGTFATKEEAGEAYKSASIKYHGEFGYFGSKNDE